MGAQDSSGKKKPHVIIWIVVIIALIVLIPGIYLAVTMNKTNYDNSMDEEIVTNEDTDSQPATGYRTITIFGVDSRSNSLEDDTRSDTIILASINQETKDVKLCSIYRDTYVNVPGYGFTKLNHAYAYGGYSLALSTINTNFDLNTSEYVTVNFYAVTRVIDLLGGITLDITDEELKWLNGYVREINRVNGTDVSGLTSSGTQTVNGTQALAYSRIRYTSGGDFKRTERQRIVVQKIFAKAKAAKLTTLLSIVNEMLPNISTNLSTASIISLAKDIFNYELSDSTGFPFEKTTQKISGVSYVLPLDLSANVTTLHEYLYDETDYTVSNTVAGYSDTISALQP